MLATLGWIEDEFEYLTHIPDYTAASFISNKKL